MSWWGRGEREGDTAWVRTADLQDASTPLVLDASQLEPEAAGTGSRHQSGLVTVA